MKRMVQVVCALPVVLLAFLAGSSLYNEYAPPPSPPVQSASAPAREEAEQAPVRATLVVTGDLMVHGEQLQDAYRSDTDSYDFSHAFAQVAGDLAEGYAVGNLETVFGGAGRGYSDYPRFNTPDTFGQALRDSGFDFVVTANNHCMDADEPGLLRTLEVLDGLGLGHTGTYAGPKERDAVCVREVEGLRIAFLSYTFSTNGIPVPAGKEHLVNMIEEPLIFGDLERAKALEPDLIVVLPHMGNEYELYTRQVFKDWMDQMIYHGADLVLASHPHVLQGMEVKKVTDIDGRTRKAFVIYSLGNFLSSQRYEPREAGLVLKLDLVREPGRAACLERVRFVPTWVQFIDDGGSYNIRVLPVADALADYEEGGNTLGLREQDAKRLVRVYNETTALYLGEDALDGVLRREHVFYEDGGNG